MLLVRIVYSVNLAGKHEESDSEDMFFCWEMHLFAQDEKCRLLEEDVAADFG